MPETITDKDRPLSPHLQVYKPQLTSMMSILHRITGAAQVVGVFLFAWLLIAAATGPEAFATVIAFCDSGIGRLMIFGWSFAFYYHLCNGIRHLFWDMGFFFKIRDAYRTGYVALIGTVVLTALTWYVILA